MKIFHDWEFIENGLTIRPISVGMVNEVGDTLYYIVRDETTITDAVHHPWLRANVVKHLPVKLGDDLPDGWDWDDQHPDWPGVQPMDVIRPSVAAFITASPNPELWAWYGAFDHVCLAWLFGAMVDLPEGVPMWTNDLKQEAVRLGDPRMPAMQPAKMEHHALHDAVADLNRYGWLRDYAKELDEKRITSILDGATGRG